MSKYLHTVLACYSQMDKYEIGLETDEILSDEEYEEKIYGKLEPVSTKTGEFQIANVDVTTLDFEENDYE